MATKMTIEFSPLCSCCGQDVSVDFQTKYDHLMIEPCKRCIDIAVAEEAKDGKKQMEEALKEQAEDLANHWNAILNAPRES